jgi:hypothetical protein
MMMPPSKKKVSPKKRKTHPLADAIRRSSASNTGGASVGGGT